MIQNRVPLLILLSTLLMAEPPRPEQAAAEHRQANAARIADAESRRLAQIADTFLEQLRTTGDRGWVQALRNLGLPYEEGFPIFRALLDHEDRLIQADAVAALGDLYEQQALPALARIVEIYAADEDLAAYEAARAIGRFKVDGAVAVPPFVEKLRRGSGSLRMRKATVEALGEIGPAAQDAAELLEELSRSKESEIAVAALKAAAKIRLDPPLPAADVRRQGAEVFAGAESARAFDALRAGEVAPDERRNLLRQVLARPDLPTPQRVVAVEELGALAPRDAESVGLLLQSRGAADKTVADAAQLALRKVAGLEPSAVSRLAEALLSDDDRVGRSAADTLLRFPELSAAAIPKAIAFLSHLPTPSDAQRIGAVLDLLRGQGAQAAAAVPALTAMLPEGATLYQGMAPEAADEVRTFTLVTLAEIGITVEAVPAIIDGLANSNHAKAFGAAARAAGALPQGREKQGMVPFLLRALEPDYPDYPFTFLRFALWPAVPPEHLTTARLEAIDAIAKIGPPAAREATRLLRERAQDTKEIPGVRESSSAAAARALEGLSR